MFNPIPHHRRPPSFLYPRLLMTIFAREVFHQSYTAIAFKMSKNWARSVEVIFEPTKNLISGVQGVGRVLLVTGHSQQQT